jgi:hypothetical protein
MVLGSAGACLVASAACAATTTNAFAFYDRVSTQVVYGTISGLMEGSNDVSALTGTVIFAQDPTLQRTFVGQGGDIVVTDGTITFADADFSNAGGVLFVGSDVPNTFYPQVTQGSTDDLHQAFNDQSSDVFKPARTVTNAFSYTDEATGQIVAGTVTGLLDGHNGGLGLVATVTRAPYEDLLGTFYGTSGDFTLTGGVVTNASGYFFSSFGTLFLGSGDDSFYPLVYNNASGHAAANEMSMPYAVFTPVAAGVPEASTWSMLIVGFGAIGVALRGQGKRGRRTSPALT